MAGSLVLRLALAGSAAIIIRPAQCSAAAEFVVVAESRPGCGLPVPCPNSNCGGRVTSREQAQRICAETAGCVAYEWSGAEGAQLGARAIPHSLWLCAVPAAALPTGLGGPEATASWLGTVLPGRAGS